MSLNRLEPPGHSRTLPACGLDMRPGRIQSYRAVEVTDITVIYLDYWNFLDAKQASQVSFSPGLYLLAQVRNSCILGT